MRLIDADALITDIEAYWDWKTVDGITATTVLKQTITDIRNAPTIDAVPVIRCKDCRYFVAEEDKTYGIEMYGQCGENGFCAWAERKEE